MIKFISIIFLLFIKHGSSTYYAASNCTGQHEVWTECENNSCQRNCETFSMNLACKPICTPGCICEKGYYRNTQEVCVAPNKCDVPICPDQNEVYSPCVSPCGETCATLGRQIICNFLVCNAGCDCKTGFFRNSTGSCVRPIKCDCPENEYLERCNNPCPPETCEDIDKMFKCAVPKKCKPACKCIKNYKRDNEGNCIPITECPKYSTINP